MKKLFVLLFALIGISARSFAQAPEKLSYQAVIRNAGNGLVSNQTVGMRISILQGSASGSAVYAETQQGSTNASGLVTLEIGSGTVVSGSFAAINWTSGPYFIKTETDPEGGSNYSLTGTSQLLSVPYALYAKTSGSSTPGPQGPAGPQGATGPQGPAGQPGAQGPTGQTGPQGIQGSAGATGAQGPIGLTGPAGATGPQGPAGPIGLQGPAGSNGKNALIRTTAEAAGANCANGGVKIEAGLDADGNGTLSDTEVNSSQTKYLCNGATGATGATGVQGPAGPAGSGGFVHYVGEQFGGGVVFHVYRDAAGVERGLVVSLNNQSEGAAWSNITNQLAGATSVTDGLSNSTSIINQQGHINSAAKLCLDYQNSGFSDWYLPSKIELNLLNKSLLEVNNTLEGIAGSKKIFGTSEFAIGNLYWSSSEYDLGNAWYIDDYGSGYSKELSKKVRAIRSYSVPSGSGNSVTDVDGNTYETITIGSQVWMKENLKVSKYRNGDAISTNLSNTAWQNTTSGGYAVYENNPVNDSIYGKLYNLYAVADPRGLCPVGWHVPSDGEWKTLESNLGMTSSDLDNTGSRGGAQNIGGKLKSNSSLWQSPNTGATNAVGFSAIPAAYRNIDGQFYGLGVDAVWWSSSLNGTNKAWSRLVTKGDGSSARFDYHLKSYGFSVRCLKD
jgi:uncharacterized protein (TIGR02145 family)